MSNHDTALALAVIAVALLWWAVSAIGKLRQKHRLARMVHDTPQVPAFPEFEESYYRAEFDRITAPLEEHVYDVERDGGI